MRLSDGHLVRIPHSLWVIGYDSHRLWVMGQYRDDYPWEDVTHFTDGLGYSSGRILRLIEMIKVWSSNPRPIKVIQIDIIFNPKYSVFFSFQWFLIGRMTKTEKHEILNCFIFFNKIIKPWFIISYDSYENAKMTNTKLVKFQKF